MIISIIQPCFMPWLGYFEQIALSDIFVYMDDVQYTKKDWRNNNQLKSQYGVKGISFPVKKMPRETLIKDICISYNAAWEDVLINQITDWYGKAPFFEEVLSLIKPVIYGKYDKLVDLNYHLNNAILAYLGIKAHIFFSSKIDRNSDNKVANIIAICKHFNNVDVLYDGKKARNFIDPGLFAQQGITVVFQDYMHTPYRQLWGEFVPYMSVVDLLMNCGRESGKIILSSPIPGKLQKRS